jgi:hypothetical protein
MGEERIDGWRERGREGGREGGARTILIDESTPTDTSREYFPRLFRCNSLHITNDKQSDADINVGEEQSRAEQSRAEQSRAEQSRAEQSRAEQSRAAEQQSSR